MKWTPKELIVITLSGMVFLVVVSPVIGATISAVWRGEPATRPEFLKVASDIVIYVLGIISGYVLNGQSPPPPPLNPPTDQNP